MRKFLILFLLLTSCATAQTSIKIQDPAGKYVTLKRDDDYSPIVPGSYLQFFANATGQIPAITYVGTWSGWTKGQFPYAAGNDPYLTMLNIGSTGQVLTVSGGAPVWANVTAASDAVITDPTTSARNVIQGSSHTVVDLTLKQPTGSPFAHLLDFQDNSGTVIGYVDASANAFFNELFATNGHAQLGDASNAAQLTLYDGIGHYTQFLPGSQSGNIVYTLPAADGSSGDFLQTNGLGVLSWASSSGGVTSITGTANQVFANGTSGSAQTGAVTLTTPQDIATSSTVTFHEVDAATRLYAGSTGVSDGDIRLARTAGANPCVIQAAAFTNLRTLTLPEPPTNGDFVYSQNSAGFGTAGYLLTSNGSSSLPTWQAPTASYTVAQTIEIDNIANVSTDALIQKNVTASTNTTPQWSPRTDWKGTTWSGAASVVADWIAENQTAVTANDQTDFVLSKGLAGTYIQELRIATDNGGTAPTFTFGGQSGALQGVGATLIMGKTPGVTSGGGDCFINGQSANGSNQFGGNFIWQVGLSTGNKDGQSAIIRSSFKGGSGSSLNTAAKLLTLTPVTTGTYQVANATFGNNTGPIGAKIVMAEVTIVSSNAGITIPDATMVTIMPAATAPFAITMPTGVTGAWLIIFNNSAQPTTGTVIAAGATNSFVYLQGAWQHIN